MRYLMRRRPRDPKLSIFAALKAWILGITLLMTLVMIGLFAYGLPRGLVDARSLLFTSIILFELFFVFSCRSQDQTIFGLGARSNMYLVGAVLSQLFLLFLIIYTPSVARLFEVSPIGIRDWLVVTLAGISGFAFAEVAKAVAGRFRSRR
jgi:Ca2+-transporting ATPase